MKRRILLFLSLCFLAGTCCMAGNLSKEAAKSYKKVCKQLKRDGWTTYDKAMTLEDAMMQYYLQWDADAGNLQQVIGTGSDKNPNKAYRQAQLNASVAQASQKGITVKVFTQMIMSSSSGTSSDVKSLTQVEQSVKPVTPTVSLSRKLKDGTTEVNLYYLLKR